MRGQSSVVATIILLMMCMVFFYEAEAKTIEAGHATVSWKGKGVIDDLGDGDRVFSGTLTGTMTTPFVAGIYIEEQKKGEVYGSAHWPTLTYTLP